MGDEDGDDMRRMFLDTHPYLVTLLRLANHIHFVVNAWHATCTVVRNVGRIAAALAVRFLGVQERCLVLAQSQVV